jgi:hypothetical protein
MSFFAELALAKPIHTCIGHCGKGGVDSQHLSRCPNACAHKKATRALYGPYMIACRKACERGTPMPPYQIMQLLNGLPGHATYIFYHEGEGMATNF